VYPFERFTEKAKTVLTLAQDESEKSHHSYIGTEHLLLGLLRQGDGLAAKVLANLGVEIEKVRDTIDSVLGRDERTQTQQAIPTSRVKNVIEIAFEEAKGMNNTYVGTGHLLLGLLIEGEGIAAHVLEDLGASLDKVRRELDSLLKEQGPDEESSSGDRPVWNSPGRHQVIYRPLPGRRDELGDLERLTSEARSALALAEEEAVKTAVGYIGTEHLLAGLARQGEGTAGQVLLGFGVDLARVRTELARDSWSSEKVAVRTVLPTSDLRRAVTVLAHQEADRSPTQGVDTAQLLLAITEDDSGAAVRLLAALDVNVAALRGELHRSASGPPD
jgi:ATP-dependent Clp protease ATP-binding subunit ClpA